MSTDKPDHLDFVTAAKVTDQPLRECVRDSVERYFADLDGGEPPTGLYQLLLQEVEAPLLEVVLRECGFNQTRAAQVLGLNRGTLRKKLKEYGLS
ncbi:MAG: DNA-binding transcriptional regulator Fis [Chromatiales bacterium]|nr:DNA-binding transcriptional regulator Fis [Gammaproteobacteria bacterium]MCP5352173.1 DNA-binding transcriptional regulator Fis [Chromatiales bacterium]